MQFAAKGKRGIDSIGRDFDGTLEVQVDDQAQFGICFVLGWDIDFGFPRVQANHGIAFAEKVYQ